VNSETDQRYVAAAGRGALTALYDPALRMTMRESAWRPALVERVVAGGARDVLDVGCGTGTLSVALAAAGTRVVGVDGDEDVLARARAKAAAAGVDVEWRTGLADALPAPAASADAVVCSLLLHHLEPRVKAAALAEARRVLRPGGRLYVADWGRPADPLQRVMFFGLQLLDGFSNTRDHAAGRLVDVIAAAGFRSVAGRNRLRTVWGTLDVLEAQN
jgi:ubiquinone/menaquinone biosynthesis C-methylase UbiE